MNSESFCGTGYEVDALNLKSRQLLWARFLCALPRSWMVSAACLGLGYAKPKLRLRSHLRKFYDGYASVSGEPIQAGKTAEAYLRLRPLLAGTPAVVALGRPSAAENLVNVTGWQELESTLAEGRGLVVASAHFGSPGLVAAYLVRRGHSVVTIRQSHLQPFTKGRFAPYLFAGTTPLFAGSTPLELASVLKAAARHLSGGGVLCYLADAGFGTRTETVYLFDRKEQVRTGPLELAAQLSVPVAYGFGWYDGKGLKVEFGTPGTVGGGEHSIVEFGRTYAARLEQLMRQYPENLSWHHFERRLFGVASEHI